ncbi:MAG: DUF2007 domain-containing protein [Eubacteriales bacterium]|nr:DUF2007 domain-containing protein [Eubacteriales bacterium]
MDESRLIKITEVTSMAEAEQLIQILEENGIPAFRQGGIMDVYTANSIGGEDIMVSEKDRDRSVEILKDFRPVKVNARMKDYALPKGQKTISWLLLGMILIILIFCIYLVIN